MAETLVETVQAQTFSVKEHGKTHSTLEQEP
jgi:hypothetical protein